MVKRSTTTSTKSKTNTTIFLLLLSWNYQNGQSLHGIPTFVRHSPRRAQQQQRLCCHGQSYAQQRQLMVVIPNRSIEQQQSQQIKQQQQRRRRSSDGKVVHLGAASAAAPVAFPFISSDTTVSGGDDCYYNVSCKEGRVLPFMVFLTLLQRLLLWSLNHLALLLSHYYHQQHHRHHQQQQWQKLFNRKIRSCKKQTNMRRMTRDGQQQQQGQQQPQQRRHTNNIYRIHDNITNIASKVPINISIPSSSSQIISYSNNTRNNNTIHNSSDHHDMVNNDTSQSSATSTTHNRSNINEFSDYPRHNYRTLYPPSRPYRNGTIQVDAIHTIYFEEHGRNWRLPQSTDDSSSTRLSSSSSSSLQHADDENSTQQVLRHALFLHGGPGAGCTQRHAQFFDPQIYHIVLFDQRGCGRSTIHTTTTATNNTSRRWDFVSLYGNTTTLQHMVHDCDQIRQHLGIGHWDVILGGSWGSTVAMAYSQEYPHVIRSMILRGICLLRSCEVDWWLGASSSSGGGGGMAAKLPQAWDQFCQAVNLTSSSSSSNSNSGTTNPSNNHHDIGLDGVGADGGNVVAVVQHHQQQQQQQQDHREVLHACYDRLLGDHLNPIQRWHTAKLWMTWEHAVAAYSSSFATRNAIQQQQVNGDFVKNSKNNLPLVLVSSSSEMAANGLGVGRTQWSYQDLCGQPIIGLDAQHLTPPEHAVEQLRHGLICSDGNADECIPTHSAFAAPRPIRPTREDEIIGATSNKETFDLASGPVDTEQQHAPWEMQSLPIQAMLTCFVSVNNRYVLNNQPLLHPQRMGRLWQQQQNDNIKVIAIHGGQDHVCPVDNALELLKIWPNLELRIPLQARHSMYDPAITHEIIEATDRLALVDDFVTQDETKRDGDEGFFC